MFIDQRRQRGIDISMDDDAFQQLQDEDEQWLRSLEERQHRRPMYIKQRGQRRIMEPHQDPYQLPSARSQPAAGSLEANEQWMRTSEVRRQSRIRYLENRRQQQILEQRLEPARPQFGSLEADKKVARMMAAMGYVPGMSLGKNPHWIDPPPSSQNGFSRVGTDQDLGMEFSVARALRDLSLVDPDEHGVFK